MRREKLFGKEKRLWDDITRNLNVLLGGYHSYQRIIRWLKDMERQHPKIVTLLNIGNSAEGRAIYGLKLGTKSRRTKPVVWIDAGIHAREWVAVHTALYLIKQLIDEYYSNPKVTECLKLLDIYILPCLNPDGYEYTQSNPNNPSIRLWRKSRGSTLQYERQSGRYCQGVDLNRNFDFHFGESGSSFSPCSNIYHGAYPFSEPETKLLIISYRAVHDAILPLRRRIKAYLSLHTYSQLWIYPYSYAENKYSSDANDLIAVAHEAVNSIKKLYGTKYDYGTGPEVIYAFSGGSSDWVKQATSVKYSYIIELSPSKSSSNGFIVDKRELIPIGKEAYAGISVVIDKVITEAKQKGGMFILLIICIFQVIQIIVIQIFWKINLDEKS
uniref:Peptidase_M14 domain-containing protein n=1 Tax=Elaeophora elaphi TaxID=1147741 RepID=A0A0R3RKX5_9BILA